MKTSSANVLENVCRFKDITRIIRDTCLEPAVREAFHNYFYTWACSPYITVYLL